MHRMGAADVGDAGFREAEKPHLAFTHQLADRAGDVFHRHVAVDAVLVEQVDMVGAQALAASLRRPRGYARGGCLSR